MKRKIISAGAIVLALVVGIGVWQLLSNLDSLVAGAIEKYGSRTTETTVGVSGVHIDLRAGRGTIAGLKVGNPDGFGGGDAFSLGDITVDLDLGSVRRDPLVIDEIRVSAPSVAAVFDERGGSNLDALRKRLQEVADAAGAGAGRDEQQKKIRIKRFVFEQGRIEVDASALKIEPRGIDLPAIRLDDIGGAAGTDGEGVARAVIDAVVRRALQEVASSEVKRAVLDKVQGKVQDEVGNAVGDKAKGLLDKIGK